MKMQPIAVTAVEGGIWYSWEREGFLFPNNRFHAVLFDDGSVFDITNGWRDRIKTRYELNAIRLSIFTLTYASRDGQIIGIVDAPIFGRNSEDVQGRDSLDVGQETRSEGLAISGSTEDGPSIDSAKSDA
jgi:hypothetical protein